MEGEGVDYLFDASALYPATRRIGARLYDLTGRIAVLDLTKYEIGNALWVEFKKGSIKDWAPVAAFWGVVLRSFRALAVDEIAEAEGIAVKEDVTFYDASYICVAKKHGLTLVTQDRRLLSSAARHVPAMGLDKFIGLEIKQEGSQ
ncbi:TPA: PIN domain-containing protein [Candidatus Bathyarchaeota archaeon]|nr:PIN domain-containing protein [Candidatus Bathyarchaeota archaeon]